MKVAWVVAGAMMDNGHRDPLKCAVCYFVVSHLFSQQIKKSLD